MKYSEVTERILAISRENGLSFPAKGRTIADELRQCSRADIIEHLDYAGIIPECLGHDSTEEKLFAKYCDALVARALAELNLRTTIIQERADAADVMARADDYSLVADAKAFRLSRTAKNQKDFKVEALNSWKKDADYACLVSPLYQYPTRESQIYAQACKYHVTMLSYTHLAFLLRHGVKQDQSLRQLWDAPCQVKESKSAAGYWQAIEQAILTLTGQPQKAWVADMKAMRERLPCQAEEQILYWEHEIQRLRALSHEDAIEELIKALKIDAKISTIRDAVGEIPEGAF